MVRIKKSDHVLKTATKSRHQSLPAVLPEELVVKYEPEIEELDELRHLYGTRCESEDGDEKEVARAEGDLDRGDNSDKDDGVFTSTRLETTKHADEVIPAPDAATNAPEDADTLEEPTALEEGNTLEDAKAPGAENVPEDANALADVDADLDADLDAETAKSPATPAPQGPTPQQLFNALFSKSPADQQIGAKSLPGLRGRAAFGDTLQASKKRKFMAAASKSVPIKRLFRRQVWRATKLAAALAGVEKPGEELPGNDLAGNDLPGNDLPGGDLP